jgi:hypothetical protein
MIERVSLDGLADAGVTGLSSLYVPPVSPATADPDVLDRVVASGDATR